MVDIHSRLCEYHPIFDSPRLLSQQERGEANPGQVVFGVIVILISAPALLSVAGKLQSSFAALPAFNWFWATIITLLMIVGVVLAMLGYE
jgi:hypothetical protein